MQHQTQLFTTQDGKVIPILRRCNYPHRRRAPGGTGVCVSAVGSYFGVTPDTYRYLWSYSTGVGLLLGRVRKAGYRVTNVTKRMRPHTMTVKRLQDNLMNWSDFDVNDKFIVVTSSHILVLAGDGSVACDTRYMPRGKVDTVHHVKSKS